MNLAEKIHTAYSAYGELEWELFEAIEAIVGEGGVEDSHVESDSVYDNSVEIVMAEGVTLTDEHREKIKALGFARIWCDGKYKRKITLAARQAELDTLRARVAELEAMLRSVEWVYDGEWSYYFCACCTDRDRGEEWGEVASGTHEPDCALAAALAQRKEPQ